MFGYLNLELLTAELPYHQHFNGRGPHKHGNICGYRHGSPTVHPAMSPLYHNKGSSSLQCAGTAQSGDHVCTTGHRHDVVLVMVAVILQDGVVHC